MCVECAAVFLEVVDHDVDFKLFRLLKNSSMMPPSVEHRSDQRSRCHISHFFATNIVQRVQEPNRELDIVLLLEQVRTKSILSTVKCAWLINL